MKVLYLVFFGTLLHLAAVSAASGQRPEPDTLFGMAWGMPYKECLQVSKNGGEAVKSVKDQSIRYRRGEEHFVLDFNETGKLASVSVSRNFKTDNDREPMDYLSDRLRQLNERYGEYLSHQSQSGQIVRFEWKGKHSHASLYYHIPTHTVTAEYLRRN